MEFLFVILAVFWVITKAAKGTKTAQNAQAQHKAPNGQKSTQQKRAAQSTAHTRHARPQARPAQVSGSHGEYTPMTSTEGLSSYKPIEHRLDTSGRHVEMTGSLGGESTEGIDTCDPSLEHQRDGEPRAHDALYTADQPTATGLRFDAGTLLGGVIMSEILTRPSQRKWGHRAHG